MPLPEPAPATPATGLYLNDNGSLPLETRRVLVQLLSGPALEARRHPKLWPILLRDEAAVQNRLADLFLHLVIDREQEIAFTRQVVAEDLDAPILLRRTQLTFVDSVLLLALRQRLTQADAQGERAVVARDELVEDVRPYAAVASTDHAGFNKRASASIEKFKKYALLHKLRGSDERYEISPTLKLLFAAEDIIRLRQVYEAMRQGGAPAAEVDEEDEA